MRALAARLDERPGHEVGAFWAALHAGTLERGRRRFLPIVLAAVVAALAVIAGTPAAILATVVIAVGYVALIAVVASGAEVRGPLDPGTWGGLVDGGLPTLLWDVHDIELAAPAGSPGRVWASEVLAGRPDGAVLVTFGAEDGPVYHLYAVDPAAIAQVRSALGVDGGR